MWMAVPLGGEGLCVGAEAYREATENYRIVAPETAPVVPRRLKIVAGQHSGAFRSVSGLPKDWTLAYGEGRVTIGPHRGIAVIVR